MFNPLVQSVVTSPITETRQWLEGRTFPSSRPLLDVSQAVPGYPPARALRAHLASELNAPATARYTQVLGIPELREAFAGDISRAYRAQVSSEHVGITAGCNQAFCLAIMAIASPGDEVIVPTPYYFNHDMWLRMLGIVPVYLPTGDDMTPDPADVAGLITERTRALLLVTPNNPTGSVYPPAVIADLYGQAARNGIHLIVDETYRDFRATTDAPHPLFDDDTWPDSFIHLYSFSKVFSITGYRVGAMAGSAELLHEIDKIADCITICPSTLGQQAALFGLGNLAGWVDGNRMTMAARVERFDTLMEQSASGYRVSASGAYFAYVRHPHPMAARQVALRLLETQHVLALAGSMFGPTDDGHLRLAFANLADDAIPDLVTRLAADAER